MSSKNKGDIYDENRDDDIYWTNLLDVGIKHIDNDPKLQCYRCCELFDNPIAIGKKKLPVCKQCHRIVEHWVNIGYDYKKISM